MKVGLIGGTGYVAGELIRLLIHHPFVEIAFIHSHSQAGKEISTVHTDLFSEKHLKFTDSFNTDEVDLIFSCLGHGVSNTFFKTNHIPHSVKIIDLSADFRLFQNAEFQNRNFIYGLPELSKEKIKLAHSIANPGCFATAIQLGLLPIIFQKESISEFHIHGITGATGAGKNHSETSHFSWRSNNISIYKALTHQHLAEIQQSFISIDNQFMSELNFIPVRGNFTRGIFVSIYFNTEKTESELIDLFNSYYENEPFVFVSNQEIHLKQVVNTNFCLIHIQKTNNKAVISSAIDNLLKGAAGQAIQNMNLVMNFPEKTGLELKSTLF
jgi:N-acetyl-gamma-glutamyl-phosphate reductase